MTPQTRRLLQGNFGRVRIELVALALALLVALFWIWELRHALSDISEREQAQISRYQEQQIALKAEEFRDLFKELFQSARTISLLPMLRNVEGGNRRDGNEDVVAAGRMSPDTDRTLQQIYSNLQSNIKVSEIYYVLDGFRPEAGEVPFFMYDDHIVGIAERELGSVAAFEDVPAEVEDFEYAYYLKQLKWFREHEPVFRFENKLNDIPALISPLMRTCDNTQFLSERHGHARDVEGLLYALPVYDASSLRFKGLISIVLRANVLEAALLGVPYLPVTDNDRERMATGGWAMPEKPASFVLSNPKYAIEIADRRNPLLAKGLAAAQSLPGLRWAAQDIALHTDSHWVMRHVLTADEVADLAAPFAAERQKAIAGRLLLLAALALLTTWALVLYRRWQRDLLWMAEHDSLTELPNRRLFFDRLDEGIARADRGQHKLGLLFIDIVDFNAVNDMHGHQGGDRLLVEVGRRLRDRVRASDSVIRMGRIKAPSFTVSRLGGDEFTVILDQVDQVDSLPPLTDRLLSSLRQPFLLGADEVEIHLSIGVAVYPDDAANSEALLLSADSAMQACRADGGGYRLFNEAMRKKAERQHQLSLELQMALAREEFRVFYQPKERLADASIVSVEALLRWNHPLLGMISPFEFIPLLEKSGMIVEVGEWVLKQACIDLRLLHEAGYDDLQVSVNASMRQLRRNDFVEMVGRVIAMTGVPASCVIIEVTESMMMDNLDQGTDVLRRLRESGVKVAIDDFGTGYSSLTYLQHLPVDYLKLDKTFIDDMASRRGTHIVQTVIELARGLSMTTIAEGIEQPEQRQQLAEMGCDMIQGYLLSRPVPVAEIRHWLAARTAQVTVEA